MTDRKSLKIRGPTARRFDHWQRDGESQTDALARLLDEAGVPEFHECVECGANLQTYVVRAYMDGDEIVCLDCAGIDPEQIP